MYTLMELSEQYGRLSQKLYKRMRMVRIETERTEDPTEAYLLRQREALLRDMWRETRDISRLLAHYYDGARQRPHAL